MRSSERITSIYILCWRGTHEMRSGCCEGDGISSLHLLTLEVHMASHTDQPAPSTRQLDQVQPQGVGVHLHLKQTPQSCQQPPIARLTHKQECYVQSSGIVLVTKRKQKHDIFRSGKFLYPNISLDNIVNKRRCQHGSRRLTLA